MITQKYGTSLGIDVILGLMRDEIGDWDIEDDAIKILEDNEWAGYLCVQWKTLNLFLMWKKIDGASNEVVLGCDNDKYLRKGKRILTKLNFEDKNWFVRKILSAACDSKRLKQHEVWFNVRIIAIGIILTCISLFLRLAGNDQTWLLSGLTGITSSFLWGMYKYGSMKQALDIQFLAVISGALLAVYVFPSALLFYLSLDWFQSFLSLEGPLLLMPGLAISTVLLVPAFLFLRRYLLQVLENHWALIRKNVLDSTKKAKHELPLIESKLAALASMRWVLTIFLSWLFSILFVIFVVAERVSSAYGISYFLLYPIFLLLAYYLTIRESFSVGRITAARTISGYPDGSLTIQLGTILVSVSPSWINRAESLNLIWDQ